MRTTASTASREMTTRKPIIVPPSPRKVAQKAKKEPPVSKKVTVLSLADVLDLCARVADDDAAAVSSTRLDDAVRRSRRRAATAAKLREGASDLGSAAGGVTRPRGGVGCLARGRGARRPFIRRTPPEWHSISTGRGCGSRGADLATGLSGLMRVSEAPAAARDALTSIVDRAVDALAAYAREPRSFRFPPAPKRLQRRMKLLS